MIKVKHRTKILNMKRHFIKSQFRLVQLGSDDELIMLLEEGVELCDKVLTGSIRTKHFNDHIKHICLGLDLFVWVYTMRAQNLIPEE